MRFAYICIVINHLYLFMAKKVVSATIEKVTDSLVREQARKEKRSFSQMVDILLLKALDSIIKKHSDG